MLRTVDVNLYINTDQTVYNFPNTSLGLLNTDRVAGVAIRAKGVSKTGNILVNEDQLNGGFLTLKQVGGRDIHQSLPLSYVLQLTQSDRFQMLPVPNVDINWEESKIQFEATLSAGTVLELIIYYKAVEDC